MNNLDWILAETAQHLHKFHFIDALESAEKEITLAAFRHNVLNQSKTARQLGISRGTLITRLKKWGMI